MLRDAQNAGKRPSASPSQRKTKKPRNSGNDRFETQLEAKVAKMVCISLAPSLTPVAPLKIARVPACSPLPVAALPSMSLSQKLHCIGSRRVLCRSPVRSVQRVRRRHVRLYSGKSQPTGPRLQQILRAVGRNRGFTGYSKYVSSCE